MIMSEHGQRQYVISKGYSITVSPGSPPMRVIKLQQQLQLELIIFVYSTTVPLRYCWTLSDEIGTVT